MTSLEFRYPPTGAGRPQVLLIGNGLERTEGQPDWWALVDSMRHPKRASLSEKERDALPFPLLYQLLSTPEPAPPRMDAAAVTAEEKRLAEGLSKLRHLSNPLLDRLPTLGADHILTTNYSYCLEAAFFPRLDFTRSTSRSAKRFCLLPPREDGKRPRETAYRLHTGYAARNADGGSVGLWHIHGEVSVPRGVVVGHDRYGRLISRMVAVCGAETPHRRETERRAFRSWPELFLFGDVYVLGQGFALCEHDLWWLLRRKQRERYADGRVYFYDNGDESRPDVRLRRQLLEAHGVLVDPDRVRDPNYTAFYRAAMDAIAARIQANRAAAKNEPT